MALILKLAYPLNLPKDPDPVICDSNVRLYRIANQSQAENRAA
jgi:hypothetical protein